MKPVPIHNREYSKILRWVSGTKYTIVKSKSKQIQSTKKDT